MDVCEGYMKNRKQIATIDGLLFIVIASACGTADIHPTVAQPDVAPSTYTPSRIATVTQTPPFTPTSMYKSPTPTWKPSQTMQFIPTLPAKTAVHSLRDYLANNGNCRLPCVLGITPGISSFTEAREIMAPLIGIAEDHTNITSGIGNMFFNYYGVIIYFVENRNTQQISDVELDLGAHSRYAYYMLPNILSEYGKPASVSLYTVALPDPTVGDWWYLYMLMLYPDQGLAINYTTTTRLSGQNIIGCFADAAVIVDAYPSGHGDTFTQLLPDGFAGEAVADYKPLEDVTTMTLDDFYWKYSKDSDQCLETANDLWPLER
jgi:hypothetical protein